MIWQVEGEEEDTCQSVTTTADLMVGLLATPRHLFLILNLEISPVTTVRCGTGSSLQQQVPGTLHMRVTEPTSRAISVPACGPLSHCAATFQTLQAWAGCLRGGIRKRSWTLDGRPSPWSRGGARREGHGRAREQRPHFYPPNYSLPKRNEALLWRLRVRECLSHGPTPGILAWYSLISTWIIDWSLSRRPIDLCVRLQDLVATLFKKNG